MSQKGVPPEIMREEVRSEIRWITDAIDIFAETSVRKGEYWRTSFSEEDQRGVELLKTWLHERNMTTYFDCVGNLFGRIEGEEPGIILTGCHRDTVRHGGKYDGSLGLLSSICAVGALYKELGKPRKTVEVVATVAESRSRFISGYTGSRAIAGILTEEQLAELDEDGISQKQAMTDAGYYKGVLPTKKENVERYLELDIEQGAVMERAGQKVGLVESIDGIMTGYITVYGHQNHAGTTPMSMRSDAVPLAAHIIDQMTRWAKNRNDRVACTFGNIEVFPGVSNIIAKKVIITFDIRSSNISLLSEALVMLKEYNKVAPKGMHVEIEVGTHYEPAEMDLQGILDMRDIAAEEKMKYMRIKSGAGHDSQVISEIAPCNMILVPSEKGIAHSPLEYTSPEDMEEGYILMKRYLKKLAW